MKRVLYGIPSEVKISAYETEYISALFISHLPMEQVGLHCKLRERTVVLEQASSPLCPRVTPLSRVCELSPCVVLWFFTPASTTVISPPAGAPVWNTVPLKGSIPSLDTGWGRTLSGCCARGLSFCSRSLLFAPPLRPLDILGLALSSVWVLLACPPRRAPSCI